MSSKLITKDTSKPNPQNGSHATNYYIGIYSKKYIRIGKWVGPYTPNGMEFMGNVRMRSKLH